MPGLSHSVEVIRDSYGVPQVYADTSADLFYAQGYVQAQDRFWEMDFRRHITAGRLARCSARTRSRPTRSSARSVGGGSLSRSWSCSTRAPGPRWTRTARASTPTCPRTPRARSAWSTSSWGCRTAATRSSRGRRWTRSPGSRRWPGTCAATWRTRGIARSITAARVGVTRTDQLYPGYPFDRHQPIVTQGAVVNGVFEPNAAVTEPVPAAARPAFTAALERVQASVSALPRCSAPAAASARTRGSCPAAGQRPASRSWPTTRTWRR